MRFFVVGPQKTGSAWLRDCLSQHPGVYVPRRVNEIFFFDRYFDRGSAWYATYFPGSDGAQSVGEVAPTYFTAPAVPGRIRDAFPEARIITSFRNPIDRAWSMYRYLRQKGDTRAPFRQAVEDFPEILADGLYARHLSRYSDVFRHDQILNLIYEETVKDPSLALKKIFRFLQVDENFAPASIREKVNEGQMARSFLMSRLMHRTARSLHRQGMHEIVDIAKRFGLKKLVLRSGKRLVMDSADRDWCKAHFQRDVAELSDMLNLDLKSLWFSETIREPAISRADERRISDLPA